MLKLDSLGTIHELESGAIWSPTRIVSGVASRAAELQELGIAPGDDVMVARTASAMFFVDLFAVWQVGASAACVDANLSPPERANLVRFLLPRAILADPEFTTELGDVGFEVDVPTLGELQPEDDGGPSASELVQQGRSSSDPALILFTSGTTGDPKGVVHTFGSLRARLELNRHAIPSEAMQRTLCMLPSHFGHGLIGNCLTPLLAGHDLYLTRFGRDTATNLGTILDEHGITFLSSVPTMWRMIFDSAAAPPTRAPHRVQIGSAPLSAELWQDVIDWTGTRDVVNAYGITETANWIGGASALEFPPTDGLVGRAWGGALAVRDAEGEIHDSGEGEILVSSDAVMRGYLHRDDLTAEVLQSDWFCTGDSGSIDADGVLRIAGRRKDEINRGGVKIQPEDVDLVLMRHEDVREACTFGIADELRGEIIGCAIETSAGGSIPATEELREWCGSRLRRHAVPEQWFFVEAIPKTDRGKVNRDLVREHCLRDCAERTAPRAMG